MDRANPRRAVTSLFVYAQQLAENVSFTCRNEQIIRWDDQRLVLAIERSGSLSGAGRRLSVSHATVFRRLQTLKQRLGVRLFEQSVA